MNLLDFIEAMENTGVSPEQILASVKAMEAKRIAEEECKKEKRREQTRERVKKYREKRNVTQSNTCNALRPLPDVTPVTGFSSPSFPPDPLTNPISSKEKGIPPKGDIPKKKKLDLGVEFEQFWEKYPTNGRRKGSRKGASAKFEAARAISSFEEIMAGVEAYGSYLRDSDEFNADAEAWLNPQKERWKDDYNIDKPPKPHEQQENYEDEVAQLAASLNKKDEVL